MTTALDLPTGLYLPPQGAYYATPERPIRIYSPRCTLDIYHPGGQRHHRR